MDLDEGRGTGTGGSEDNPRIIGRDYAAFADETNLDHCAKYLNQSLVTFGFPASLDLFAGDPEAKAKVGFKAQIEKLQQERFFAV
ncbi:hypothetical protein QJS04_geneDACA013889 [Acorus gramineus]|uniref:Uncharacterized protein n=1 Tax=Acorus gramineus TaxID=55184 RepID=A0AAV9AVA3_ACOGR|nr:hypothetical protein QJS04_geneDACA013889 [Acorus gramineus]